MVTPAEQRLLRCAGKGKENQSASSECHAKPDHNHNLIPELNCLRSQGMQDRIRHCSVTRPASAPVPLDFVSTKPSQLFFNRPSSLYLGSFSYPPHQAYVQSREPGTAPEQCVFPIQVIHTVHRSQFVPSLFSIPQVFHTRTHAACTFWKSLRSGCSKKMEVAW